MLSIVQLGIDHLQTRQWHLYCGSGDVECMYRWLMEQLYLLAGSLSSLFHFWCVKYSIKNNPYYTKKKYFCYKIEPLILWYITYHIYHHYLVHIRWEVQLWETTKGHSPKTSKANTVTNSANNDTPLQTTATGANCCQWGYFDRQHWHL